MKNSFDGHYMTKKKKKREKVIINGSEVACFSGSQPHYIDSRFL